MIPLISNIIGIAVVCALFDLFRKRKHGHNWKGEKIRACNASNAKNGVCAKCIGEA